MGPQILAHNMGGNNNGGNKGGKRAANGGGNKRRKRTSGIGGVTQSVAVSVNNAFGDTAKPQTIVKGLDAFDPSHVPLPRAVGDYTVIRTTQVLTTVGKFNLFGPLRNASDTWSNICHVQPLYGHPTIDFAVSGNQVTFAGFEAMTGASWGDARVTPAAFTIKVMNPEALQTTSGVIYMGRAKQMLNMGGSTRTWQAIADDLVSYSSPELCAAGKLALRGVKVDAVPYDMNALSDFRPLQASSGFNGTWTNDILMFDGFAPIYLYNPNGVQLQVMVCCEWRVRFDPSNPAYASHTYHKPSTLGYWDKVQRIGSALGNGVMDMAEKNVPRLLMGVAEKAVKRQLMLPF